MIMKKIIALVTFSVILSLSLLTAFAVPSPVTSAKIGDLVITVDGVDYVIPEEVIDEYLDIIHVHEAEEGSDLHEIGQDLSTDDKLRDELGEEFSDYTLIQLFTFEMSDDFSDGTLELGEFVNNGDGCFDIENGKNVDISDAKFTVTIYMPSLREGDDISVLIHKGEWSHSEYVRVYNGYFTIDLSGIGDFDAIYAVLTEKAPLSPSTGVASYTAFLTVAFFAFATVLVWSVKKYRFEK